MKKCERRLLTIGHSYVVGLNRRLAHEMARAGAGQWEVVAVAPRFVHGDLRPIALEPIPDEACRVEAVKLWLSRKPHVMFFGRQLRRLLRSERWDVVHAWQEPFTVAGAQIAWHTPHPTKYVFATFQNLRKDYPFPFSFLERYTVQRAAGWIPFGHTVAETLQQKPLYTQRVHQVIPPGVDLEHFRPCPEQGEPILRTLGWDRSIPIIGMLGRFVPEKGFSLIQRVLERLTTPWRALFVGGGGLENDLRQWAERFASQVRIVTGVTHEQVPAYLNAMSLLVAPSQTTPHWREQLGRMIIEAFACAVPVVGSDSGEIPFVIGDAGRVVGEADEDAWRNTLEELLTHPESRQSLGSRGRERAEQVFAWPVVARQHLEFFDRLLADNQPP